MGYMDCDNQGLMFDLLDDKPEHRRLTHISSLIKIDMCSLMARFTVDCNNTFTCQMSNKIRTTNVRSTATATATATFISEFKNKYAFLYIILKNSTKLGNILKKLLLLK
ncbi:hypothetical protein PHYBLDRAFT_173654 [Phycomyces blakesleeanus NRRL 1555(-)]|uniref:Uncharacterized protein n=1 Tax=Phycomyces blakesleeanus (strain ATCC 8743b / DSM 1359 / FGSC 10004 / NBRC 33097 / NRRL 1555) TaxID=763407 RepID=A0A162NCQ3_PHYB8|nr:hypothetical protein PHYBLDRAFT_173654 [Phycomyces blakesleeanus NRRL 1555(-)]OAD68164.1 hypothetical protein PHYBLDRAFT_173654 [Phycomyces blakesleeanus NRRL 1555(-)]|eukprot:XP_018286204.1 hypothetical protein PHYBLDRAFT_173654 [Phycomyces blakesleeanus NRRL 1555(-)]